MTSAGQVSIQPDYSRTCCVDQRMCRVDQIQFCGYSNSKLCRPGIVRAVVHPDGNVLLREQKADSTLQGEKKQ
eukprot:372994-Prymnesium_polylepis.2